MSDEELAELAAIKMDNGYDGQCLVHLTRDPDGAVTGISSCLAPDTNLSGYTESYYTLQSIINFSKG